LSIVNSESLFDKEMLMVLKVVSYMGCLMPITYRIFPSSFSGFGTERLSLNVYIINSCCILFFKIESQLYGLDKYAFLLILLIEFRFMTLFCVLIVHKKIDRSYLPLVHRYVLGGEMESEIAPKQKCPMEKRERFIRLYDVILDIYRTYNSNFVWTVGLLSLSIGWFLSSSSSRDFIRTSVPAFIGAILVASTIGILHTVGSWMFYRHSQERITELTTEYTNLQPLPFRVYEIRRSILVLNLIVSWMLVAGLITFVVAAHISLP